MNLLTNYIFLKIHPLRWEEGFKLSERNTHAVGDRQFRTFPVRKEKQAWLVAGDQKFILQASLWDMARPEARKVRQITAQLADYG